ncbi:MAG: M23 family metallopeptidase [Alicyclobacillaceae bacterium]|nr:M23 family metallopeptidase [Alicyclobacillaceae bacterium]
MSIIAWYFVCCSWHDLGRVWRHVWLGVCAFAGTLSVVQVQQGQTPPGIHADTVMSLLFVLWFGGNALNAWRGRRCPDGSVQLSFPLRHGSYMVVQGGSTSSVNYHRRHPLQTYAMDVVKVNRWGRRCRGLFPSQVERYFIYGDPVYSPCAGQVVHAEGNIKDPPAPHTDHVNPAGNHVVIQSDGCRVVLAHPRCGSVRVAPGDRVLPGQIVGEVGNSGNSTEPHLHVHAEVYRDDLKRYVGVPIRFNGRFFVRNSVVHAGTTDRILTFGSRRKSAER